MLRLKLVLGFGLDLGMSLGLGPGPVQGPVQGPGPGPPDNFLLKFFTQICDIYIVQINEMPSGRAQSRAQNQWEQNRFPPFPSGFLVVPVIGLLFWSFIVFCIFPSIPLCLESNAA